MLDLYDNTFYGKRDLGWPTIPHPAERKDSKVYSHISTTISYGLAMQGQAPRILVLFGLAYYTPNELCFFFFEAANLSNPIITGWTLDCIWFRLNVLAKSGCYNSIRNFIPKQTQPKREKLVLWSRSKWKSSMLPWK